MSPEERTELQRDAQRLAYQVILHTGLYKSLTGPQWDARAATWGWLVVELLSNLVAEDETALQTEREAATEASLALTLETERDSK